MTFSMYLIIFKIFYMLLTLAFTYQQGRIYYEANEASASGPHHLGGPHQNFNAVSNVNILLRKKFLKVNLL